MFDMRGYESVGAFVSFVSLSRHNKIPIINGSN